MNRAMTCGEARNLASEMLDGGLTAADEAAVKEHVASCQTCPGLYRAMVAVHDRMGAFGREAIPPAFGSTLTSILEKESGGE